MKEDNDKWIQNPLFNNIKAYKLPSKFDFQKNKTRSIYIPPVKYLNIIELMRNIKKYSFMQFPKQIIGELHSTNEIQKSANETQLITEQHQKKGFQFSQYCANNPIQDSIRFFKIPELNAFIVSIFDGHGGPQLSQFCAKKTPQYFQKYLRNEIKLHKYANNKIQLIKDALTQLHRELQKQYYKQYLEMIGQNKKIKGVGTCAITLVLYENKCIVANCGDSQSMVISQNSGSYNYHKLSEIFSVNNKSERQRLIKQFGQIDKNIIVEERKNAFYLKGMLQPTRSIGDYYLKHKQHWVGQGSFEGPYISFQPDIRVYDLKEHDKYIVIASDGLWDYLSKWQILKYIIESKNDKNNIAERETESETQNEQQKTFQFTSTPQYLTQKILQKVANDFQVDIKYVKSLQLGQRRSYHDDITIGIIDIKEFFESKLLKD